MPRPGMAKRSLKGEAPGIALTPSVRSLAEAEARRSAQGIVLPLITIARVGRGGACHVVVGGVAWRGALTAAPFVPRAGPCPLLLACWQPPCQSATDSHQPAPPRLDSVTDSHLRSHPRGPLRARVLVPKPL